jgi:ribosomal protein L4
MLCSKLLENKLVLYNSEKLNEISTQDLSHILKMYRRNKILFVTGIGYDINFEKSQRNLKFVKHVTPEVSM